MWSVRRSFPFCAAHRIIGHSGKCKFVHGHNYSAEVTVTTFELNKLGMVIDFSDLKAVVGGFIDENWDHNILLFEGDPLVKALKKLQERDPYLMTCAPTAENLAKELFDQVRGMFPDHLMISEVLIQETNGCSADYSPVYANIDHIVKERKKGKDS